LVDGFRGAPASWLTDGIPLTARITAPATVAAGSVLMYRVTIHGPEAVTDLFVFGCPSYTETLGPVSEHHELNCYPLQDNDRDHPLALAARHLEMRLTVPPRTPPGPATLSWQAEPPYHRARASTTITIRPADHRNRS
jgi:hypothetical protein